MAELPEYQQRQQLGAGPSPSVRAIPLPQGMPAPPAPPAFADTSSIGRAMSAFGAELTSVALKLKQGEQHTLMSQAMEGFLTQRADLQQKYTDDRDFTTAEARFKDDIAAAQRGALERISDPQLRAQASLAMTRDAISSGARVHAAQVARQADINIAGNEALGQASLTEAATAASPAERGAAIDRYIGDLERLQAAGWIDAVTAVKRMQAFRGQLDGADAMTLIQRDPVAARSALADPNRFTSLDPVRRASLVQAAEQRADSNQQAQIVNAAAFHPEAASLSIGRVIAPGHAQKIFDNGILPIESGGDNRVVSNKGALGVAQLMPGTAREVASSLGLKDVAALPDADLKARLLSDESLNRRLGSAYWQQMVTRYDGNVALAAAAYNAGPGRADAWKAQAEKKFGANFSTGQFASVVDIKETRDYLGKLYGKFGAPMDVAFSSPASLLHAASAVGSVLQQTEARERHLLSVQAAAGAASDPVANIVKLGYDVDPLRIDTFRAAQSAAAAGGDAAAAGRLRDLDFALKLQPMVRAAWSMPPAALDAEITRMEAAATAQGGNPVEAGLDALKALKAVRDDQIKRRDSEPVVLGGENGGRFYQLQPLDPGQPLGDTMIAALKNRDAQALTAHRAYGGSGSPFTAQEATAWKQKYSEAAPQERNADPRNAGRRAVTANIRRGAAAGDRQGRPGRPGAALCRRAVARRAGPRRQHRCRQRQRRGVRAAQVGRQGCLCGGKDARAAAGGLQQGVAAVAERGVRGDVGGDRRPLCVSRRAGA